MKHSLFSVACLAMLFSFGMAPASAAPMPASTPVPRALPDFSPMNMFLGTWTCRQTVRGSTRTDTSTTSMALNGMWMVTHDVAPPFDKFRTSEVVSDSYVTYNPTSRLWVTTGVDSFGGYFVSTTPGWQGNTLASQTTVTNDGSKSSDVLTKISDTQTTDAFVNTDPQGTVTHNTVACAKH